MANLPRIDDDPNLVVENENSIIVINCENGVANLKVHILNRNDAHPFGVEP